MASRPDISNRTVRMVQEGDEGGTIDVSLSLCRPLPLVVPSILGFAKSRPVRVQLVFAFPSRMHEDSIADFQALSHFEGVGFGPQRRGAKVAEGELVIHNIVPMRGVAKARGMLENGNPACFTRRRIDNREIHPASLLAMSILRCGSTRQVHTPFAVNQPPIACRL